MVNSREDDERDLTDDLGEDFESEELEDELEADLIEEWCPVCREIKPHAVVGRDKIACAVCNHEHSRDGESQGIKPVVIKLVSDKELASEESRLAAWKRLTNVDESDIQKYTIRLKLAEGDVIRHSVFGIGVVIEVNDGTKAEVLFESGVCRLICGK